MRRLILPVMGMCVTSLAGCAGTPKPDPFVERQVKTHYTPIHNTHAAAYHTPRGSAPDSAATSLWSSSPKSLFGDRRASQSGDILTVLIEIDDEAELSNSVTSARQNDEGFSLNSFFGLADVINDVLPEGTSLSPGIDVNRGSTSAGDGSISRGEQITLRLAAQVVDVLPNGYLELAGQQKIMVNQETRLLQVTGIVRTQDISRLNTITYDKIADANIYYGGQGSVSAATQRARSSEILQKYIPF